MNLALNVLGRRPDGLHDLSMLNATVPIADEVAVETAPALSLEVEGPDDVPSGAANLVWRAALALAGAAGVAPRARVRLVKRIPAAAGLGGGSADAATALVLLRDLWRLDLDDGLLAEIGLSLGADVPFSLAAALAGGALAAVVEGVGERIEPFRPAAPLALVVANPGWPLATRDVFAAHAAAGAPPRDRRADVRRLRDAWAAGRLDGVAAGLSNDLLPAAASLRPDLEALGRRLLEAGARAAVLSGSGPTWIGLFDDAGAAGAAAEALRRDLDASGLAAAVACPAA